jgi:uncharacterized NAD-dependent epimerase/dehydratase family protein
VHDLASKPPAAAHARAADAGAGSARIAALPTPYLLFLGGGEEALFAKTAFGLRDWAPQLCVAQFGLPGAANTGLPQLSPREAVAGGARGAVIAVASMGGAISQRWMPPLLEALEAGLDVVSGMHTRLSDVPELAAAARRLGRRLIDVRQPPANIPIATGRKRTGKRLLTVGTDCALGKKYTALALHRAFRARGVPADFRATGQTGILISGAGIPIDSVVADFAAGAAEILSPDAASDHWDVVEGQGSIFHPSYAGVSLGLLHGTQPDVIVVCHEAGRTHMGGIEGYALPTLRETIDLSVTLGRRTNPAARCAAVSLNTSRLSEPQARQLMRTTAAELGVPVGDPIRGGEEFDACVEACLR